MKFFGIYKTEVNIYLVSPFVENGALPEYLNKHPLADRWRLVSANMFSCRSQAVYILVLFQVYETALAIEYLHKAGVIHGDIKGANILVSLQKSALLCDFGLARDYDSATSVAQKGGGSLRWQSPELLDHVHKSYASDVYAFGMTIYEVNKTENSAVRES